MLTDDVAIIVAVAAAALIGGFATTTFVSAMVVSTLAYVGIRAAMVLTEFSQPIQTSHLEFGWYWVVDLVIPEVLIAVALASVIQVIRRRGHRPGSR